MAIASRTLLSRYRLEERIGAGGMGEVYRARDTRLERDVAVKILPASLTKNADRLLRFEQEARSTGALHHPNIVAVYDAGSDDGSHFLVTELLEGETLKERMRGRRLPLRKAIEYAQHIARGLAAAHEKSIVHRDLKPENIFVCNDGQVKIFDFGLAKLTESRAVFGVETDSWRALETQPGTVLGTAAYMAPEQVRGEAATPRSDIFSFGSILYEMLCGQRPFQGASAIEAMHAVLDEEPRRLSEAAPDIPPALERLVDHCLEKNPGARFQSAHDLAYDLGELSGISSHAHAAAPATGRAPLVQRKFFLPAAALLALCAVAAIAFLAGRHFASMGLPTFHRLTYRRGLIDAARMSPDNGTVVYSASWEGANPELYYTRLGNPESRQLGIAGAKLLSISRAGELAVLLDYHLIGGFRSAGTLARVPLSGGAPRELLENVEDADWTPDSRLLVVRQVGGKVRIELPIGTPIYETAGWVSNARISPSGERIAFVDHPQNNDDAGYIAVLDLRGKKTVIAGPWLSTMGLAWDPAGDRVWFTGTEGGNSRLLYVATLEGRVRAVSRVPGTMTLEDVTQDRQMLLTETKPRLGIAGVPPGERKERDFSGLDWSLLRDVSPDGRTLLFDETGDGGGANQGVYMRRVDQNQAIRLGDGTGWGFSPDGKRAISMTPRDHQIVLLPTGAGEPLPLPAIEFNVQGVRWFPDGKRLLILGNEPSKGVKLYALSVTGDSKPRALSAQEVSPHHTAISPDGKTVAAVLPDRNLALFSVEGPDVKPLPGTYSMTPIRFDSDPRFLFVAVRNEMPTRIYRLDTTTGKRETAVELAPLDRAGLIATMGVRLANDNKSYYYSYARSLDDLYLVDGLR